MQIQTLATQPGALRALRRSIVAVGGAGVAAIVLATFGGGVMDAAASAAVSGGGAYGPGAASPSASSSAPSGADADSAAAVAGLAAAAPVQVGALEAEPIVTSPLQGAVGETAAAPAASAVIAPASVPRVEAPRPEPGPPPAPGSVQALIHEVFGDHGSAAVGVARCESGLNPNAVSRGGGNWGLFQINKVHRGRVQAMGYAWEDILDPRVNAVVAKSIFDEQGWRPWACRHAA